MGSKHPNIHDKDHLVRCVFLDSQEIKRLDITPIRGRRYAPILAFFSPPSTTEVVATFCQTSPVDIRNECSSHDDTRNALLTKFIG